MSVGRTPLAAALHNDTFRWSGTEVWFGFGRASGGLKLVEERTVLRVEGADHRHAAAVGTDDGRGCDGVEFDTAKLGSRCDRVVVNQSSETRELCCIGTTQSVPHRIVTPW